MYNRGERRSFWGTVPGILSGIAAVITAIGGLMVILRSASPPTPTLMPPTVAPVTPTPTVTPTASVEVTPTHTPTLATPTITPTSIPSPTPTPTPTPSPTPTATPSPLLYSDDFSDPSSGWSVSSDEDSERGYYDGEYYILVKTTELVSWAYPGRTFTDFRLEVDVQKVAGPDDNQFGVVGRYRDSDNFYVFAISSDGYYRVRKRINDEWETLVAWETSPHINQSQSTNHLTLIAQGPNFDFYVNGRPLAHVVDASFAEGDIGLLAGAIDEAGVRIHFDNLEVWVLP